MAIYSHFLSYLGCFYISFDWLRFEHWQPQKSSLHVQTRIGLCSSAGYSVKKELPRHICCCACCIVAFREIFPESSFVTTLTRFPFLFLATAVSACFIYPFALASAGTAALWVNLYCSDLILKFWVWETFHLRITAPAVCLFPVSK